MHQCKSEKFHPWLSTPGVPLPAQSVSRFLSGLLQPDMVMPCLAFNCTRCAHVASLLLVAGVALHVSEKVGKSVAENETCAYDAVLFAQQGLLWLVVVACWNNPPVGACFVFV